MASPFYVAPLGGLDVGGKMTSILEGGRERYKEQQWEKNAPDIIKSGDPAKIADLMTQYPEKAQQIAAISGYKDRRALQSRVDMSKKVLSGEMTIQEALAQHIQEVDAQGGDTTQLVNQLGKALADPNYGQKWAANTLALYEPDSFEQFSKLTMAQPAGLTASQKDYALAKKEGFKGSFIDFKQALSANPQADLETLKLQTQILDIQQRMQEREAKKESAKQMTDKKNRSLVNSVDNLLEEVDRAVGIAKNSPTSTGIPGAATSVVPGSPSYNLRKTLDTVKANLGFDKLQEMRDSSPTGGALGQVSERELNFLQSTLTALDPNMGEERLVQGLEKVKRHYNAWRDTMLGKMPEQQEVEEQEEKSISEMSDEELKKAAGIGGE